MTTLHRLATKFPDIPMITGWYLSDLAEAKGRQQLYTRQSPQRLKALREYAMIESAIASNRIEGVEIDPARARTVILGKPAPRDRNEEEVSGYRDALRLIHEWPAQIEMSEKTILELHRISRGHGGDAGEYKGRDVDIIETYANGGSRVRFKSVPALETPKAVRGMIDQWNAVSEKSIPPLVAIAALNLDFLCIHPFRDGNGRVSRLLLLLQCYHAGFEVGRYISLERIIEQHKERYYETLEQSSHGWHEDTNDPWPYVNYLLFVLREAYREFEQRVGQMAARRGEKTAFVLSAIERSRGPFGVSDLQRHCPGVGLDLIRRILKQQKKLGRVAVLGRGPSARWQKVEGE